MMRSDFFQRLPVPTALLLLSRLFELAQAHAFPRQTSTVPYRILEVVSWPLAPTPPPALPDELRRRDIAADAICGYIGGNPSLPATCSPGSHCVLDAVHGAIGCCPNNDGACTAGVFTGCVDSNSGPQTELNPYVFTCGGGDVCYKNNFAGGYSQFGCGSASDLATTVPLSASGVSSLVLTSVSVPFTAPTTTLATPTTIPSTGTRTSTGSTTSRPTTTSTSSSSKSSTTSALPTGPTDSAGQGGGGGSDKTGAIIGGAISGAAVLIALAALAFWLIRKRRRNTRTGPGAGGTAYVRYDRITNPIVYQN